MYKVEVIVRVVNDLGEVVDAGGNVPITRMALQASRTLSYWYNTPSEANNALSLVWAFLEPIDELASRHPVCL